jgi:hypothetical protein
LGSRLLDSRFKSQSSKGSAGVGLDELSGVDIEVDLLRVGQDETVGRCYFGADGSGRAGALDALGEVDAGDAGTTLYGATIPPHIWNGSSVGSISREHVCA